MLNKDQKKVAIALFEERPPVVPGTRAIINSVQAETWHHKVTASAKVLKLDTERDLSEFFDLAGVAD